MSANFSSVCKICTAGCGVRVTIGANGRVEKVRADHNHILTAGHACFKGIRAADTLNSPNRILTAQKRIADGTFEPISVAQALDEIAEILTAIGEKYGASAIATYAGQPAFLNALTLPMMNAFREAIHSDSHYTSETIDQPGKTIAAERLGYWHAGKTPLVDTDVLMLIGTNPMVSFQCPGALTTDPVKTLRRARERGMKLIVIDPRRTETAEHADVFVQPYPGQDVTVLAALINLILQSDSHDRDFCIAHVKPGQLQLLLAATARFTVKYAVEHAGVSADALRAAASTFAAGPRGSVFSGVGPSMGRNSSLAEHLVEVLNVICGRFPRQGSMVRDVVPWLPYSPRHAQVVGPTRSWANLPPSRIRGIPKLNGQKLTCNLADEIRMSGPDQIRAIINIGGNLAANIPDQRKIVAALKELEILVSVEPFFTNTARLSHYVLAPKLQYERVDLPLAYAGASFRPVPWAQYLAAIAAPPVGSEVIDDWYIFWGLAQRMQLPLRFYGVPLGREQAPNGDELLQILANNAVVPLAEIKRFPNGGKIFDIEQIVQPQNDTAGKFEPMPSDVQSELADAFETDCDVNPVCSGTGIPFTHLLSVRRSRDLMNSQGLYVAGVRVRAPYNPASLNPADMADLGLSDGDEVLIVSQRDQIAAVVQQDASVRAGVITMSHSWGGLPDEICDYDRLGANTNRLLDGDRGLDRYTAQAIMTGVHVYIIPGANRSSANARRRVPS